MTMNTSDLGIFVKDSDHGVLTATPVVDQTLRSFFQNEGFRQKQFAIYAKGNVRKREGSTEAKRTGHCVDDRDYSLDVRLLVLDIDAAGEARRDSEGAQRLFRRIAEQDETEFTYITKNKGFRIGWRHHAIISNRGEYERALREAGERLELSVFGVLPWDQDPVTHVCDPRKKDAAYYSDGVTWNSPNFYWFMPCDPDHCFVREG